MQLEETQWPTHSQIIVRTFLFSVVLGPTKFLRRITFPERRRRREGERRRISGETFWNGWPRPGNWEKRRLEKRLRITHTLPKSINKWGGGREEGIFLNIVSSLNTSATRSHPRISTGSEFYYLYIHLDCSVVVTLFPSKLPTSADDDLDDFENISKQ
jgi:hypothetical protein